ncbi:MAG: ABC transporter substrate-binding protein [Rhodospirillales bacterium]|nr:ABC transporter substrate-binding protein [Rhodospirillales bacterium]
MGALLLLTLWIPTGASAQNGTHPVELYLFEIEGVASSTEILPPHRLLLRTLEGLQTPVKTRLFPLSRALDEFWKNQKSCKYPASIAASRQTFPENKNVALIESDPFFFTNSKVYSREDDAVFNSLSQLYGRSVGTLANSTLEKIAIASGATVYAAKHESHLYDMLMHKRIDAVLAYHPHFLTTIDISNRQTGRVQFSEEFSIIVNQSAIVCLAEAREVLEAVNTQLQLLRESGELDQIVEPFGTIIPSSSADNNG